jgi:ubiquinone/menaquinone biosynthesis C-methylase UbiE
VKICSACGSPYPFSEEICPACGSAAVRKNGFIPVAPELAEKQEGFKAEFYEQYAHLEASHFWFRSRARLIEWSLRKYVPRMRSFLEIGCGTGYILSKVANAFPSSRLLGSEMFAEGLRFASERVPSAAFMQMDARHIPFIDEFETIGAFDVLEHIEADTAVLAEMHRALKKDGIILLTVPQHAWLWSQVDEYSCHVRRYSAKELHQKIEDTGFSILRSTSFVATLLPAMIISRGVKRRNNEKNDTTAELAVPKIINALFDFLMWLEYVFIKAGGNIPIGGSRLVIAKKKIINYPCVSVAGLLRKNVDN